MSNDESVFPIIMRIERSQAGSQCSFLQSLPQFFGDERCKGMQQT